MARNFLRKVILSSSTDLLRTELTTLISSVFLLHDYSAHDSDKDAAEKRLLKFHLFRIMSDISGHSSGSASASQTKSRELISRSMIAALTRCAVSRGADPSFSSIESHLITLSVALEWLSLTTSGQVQNGSAALPVTYQSMHPYPDTVHQCSHDIRIIGATSIKIHFNKKSETHSPTHCIAFSSGGLPRPQLYSLKTWAGVGSTPKLVVDGDSVSALFKSDGGGSNWGYSFTVTPVFPDLSSLLLLPLRVAVFAICFSSTDRLLKGDAAIRVPPSEVTCPVASLIDEVLRGSDIGQKYQHLVRGPNSLACFFKESQDSLSSLLSDAHAASRVHAALPHVSALSHFQHLHAILCA
jgi:hypothetical protein